MKEEEKGGEEIQGGKGKGKKERKEEEREER